MKGWLGPSSEGSTKAYCKVCNVHLTTELSTLRRHGMTANHLTKARSVKSSKPINELLPSISKPSSHDIAVKSGEIILGAFFAECNIPYRTVDTLVPVLKKIFPDSKIAQDIQLGRTKVTNIIRNVLGKSERSILAMKLKEVPFSILADESTDVSTSKLMAIVVRLYDEEYKDVRSWQWCLAEIYTGSSADSSTVTVTIDPENNEEIEINDAGPVILRGSTAEDLYRLLIKSFADFHIPDENIIGFASDGANVMLGHHNSVGSRFREHFPGTLL